MFNIEEKYPRYLYTLDPGYETEEDIEFYRNLVCTHGTISWFGKDVLYVCCKSNEKLVRKLREIPDSAEKVVGDDEAVFHVHPKHIRKVLRVLKPKLNDVESKKIRDRFK